MADGIDAPPMKSGRFAIVAAALQLPFGLAGLGYLYLGQRDKAKRAFLVVGGLALVDVLAASFDVMAVCKALGPAIWVLQILFAVDAWALARAVKRGEARSTADIELALLTPILGGRPAT